MADGELAAELTQLYQAGRVQLPAVAADYEQAARHLSSARSGESAAFQGGPYLELAGLIGITQQMVEAAQGGPPGDLWDQVAGEFEVALKHTADTLTDCAWALQTIAKQYAAADGIAVEQLAAAGGQR